MAYGDAIDPWVRARSALATAAICLLVGTGLIFGISENAPQRVSAAIEAMSISAPPPPPPPPEPAPKPERAPRPAGAAAPAAREARPKEIVAPRPRIRPQPAPVTAPPVAATGNQSNSGAAPDPGPGTGAGGAGNGTGAGGSGTGAGGGGGGARTRWRSGTIRNRDYPDAASDARIEGVVIAHFIVGVDGRVHDCRVVESSGNADLDSTTCRLIEQRFRYEPARNAAGEAIEAPAGWRQQWWLEGRR